jgi:hypothetical protein
MEKVRKKLGCAMPGVVGGTYKRAEAPMRMSGKAFGKEEFLNKSQGVDRRKSVAMMDEHDKR